MSRAGTAIYPGTDELRTVRTKRIVTPEGVPLDFPIASAGDRIWGFFLDALVIALIVLVLGLVAWIVAEAGAPYIALALFLLAFFLVRNFYFTWFEIRRQGATPGKRRAGTRVIDRHGRPLASGAVFVRNLTRELELFIPIAAVADPDGFIGGAGTVTQVVAAIWFLCLALFPLFNRDRLRVGDLIAGTIVVRAPEADLSRDVAAPVRAKEQATYEFTPEQLDVYGIYELQVLEDLLRRPERTNRDALRVVADRIIVKIDWRGDESRLDTKAFLRDFYAAQRARLEQRMLFGERREKKADADAPTGGERRGRRRGRGRGRGGRGRRP